MGSKKKINRDINNKLRDINDDIGDISTFDPTKEYMKIFKFRSSASKKIQINVMDYAIHNIDRISGLMRLLTYVPASMADKIEKGIIEFTLIHISNENIEAVEFTGNVYHDKLREIRLNLDITNKRIENKTLLPSILEGSIDPYFVAFMNPQQLHPQRWSKELEKKQVAESVCNNQKVTDIYKCRKCGDRKSTTTQMQTRSADEPVTIFVTCLTCYTTFTTQ